MQRNRKARLFGQSKQITKRTSNNQPNHIIKNIIERLQIERSQKKPLVDQEDSSIKTLGNSIVPMPNTVIPTQLMASIPNHYQAHLERISDFLSKGEGIWWKKHPLGIEFLDSSNQNDYHSLGPNLMHFRSCSLEDIDSYLHENWEMCISKKIPLPALHIRTYGTDGEFEDVVTIDMQLNSSTECDDSSNDENQMAIESNESVLQYSDRLTSPVSMDSQLYPKSYSSDNDDASEVGILSTDPTGSNVTC